MWIKHESGTYLETTEMEMIRPINDAGTNIEITFTSGEKWRGTNRFQTRKSVENVTLESVIFPVEVKK